MPPRFLCTLPLVPQPHRNGVQKGESFKKRMESGLNSPVPGAGGTGSLPPGPPPPAGASRMPRNLSSFCFSNEPRRRGDWKRSGLDWKRSGVEAPEELISAGPDRKIISSYVVKGLRCLGLVLSRTFSYSRKKKGPRPPPITQPDKIWSAHIRTPQHYGASRGLHHGVTIAVCAALTTHNFFFPKRV